MFGRRTACLVFSCGMTVVHGQNEHDRALAAIREYALNYAKSLLDYTCTRLTSSRVGYMYLLDPRAHPRTIIVDKVFKIDNGFPAKFAA